MSKLQNFKCQEISLNESSNLKGGVFCEWYINQRTAAGKTVSNGQMMQAMDLDAIVATDGEAAAMAQGGSAFMARWS
jgi:hypothetical protein